VSPSFVFRGEDRSGLDVYAFAMLCCFSQRSDSIPRVHTALVLVRPNMPTVWCFLPFLSTITMAKVQKQPYDEVLLRKIYVLSKWLSQDPTIKSLINTRVSIVFDKPQTVLIVFLANKHDSAMFTTTWFLEQFS
jgi:hypothetical protein